MPKTAAIAVLALLLAPSVALAQAQQSPAPPPPAANAPRPAIVQTNVVVDHVTVEAVDHAKRTATLRASDGQVFVVDVPQSVVNFPQVEKGDTITIRYEQATAIFLRKPGEMTPGNAAPAIHQYQSVEVAPRGEKPAGVHTTVTQITATVEAVDYARRKVTLRGPNGNSRTIDVGDEVPNLDRVKTGDQVVVQQTDALAIGITK